MNSRTNRIATSLFLCLLILLGSVAVFAQSSADSNAGKPIIEKIIIEGNERLTQDAFLAMTSLRVGGVYDEAQIDKEFRRLWASGLLENLTINATDGDKGKILTINIKERPILAMVDYTGSKKLTSSTILDQLKKNKAEIKAGSVLDYTKIKKTESALRFMAMDKGFPDAVVTSKLQTMGPGQVALTFHIEEGPKARIDKIKFMGAHAFRKMKLKYTLKKTRPHWFGSWATRHDIYSEGQYYEDIKELRKLYESEGYLDIDIGEPIVDSHLNSKGTKKWLTLTIPISEGIQYHFGKVSFEGNHVFTGDELLTNMKLSKMKVLDKTIIDMIRKNIEARYGEKGYIYATATPIFHRHKKEAIADVTFSITEDQVYFLNRLDFYGNTATRDYVLRREMKIYEQEIFNYIQYKRGLYMLKQRALFKIEKDPEIKKIPNTNTVDVNVNGEEASKNEVLFGGGYGGINGFYISGSFKTYNFLGRGTTLSLNADFGKVQKLYSINYSDPWLFGKRIGGSFSLYNSELDYLEFDQKSIGGSMSVSFPLGDFASWSVGYRYEQSKITNFSPYGYISTNYLNYLNDTTTSAVFGGIGINTVNNPFRPVFGYSAFLNTTLAGEYLGGDNDFYKPTFEGSFYLPTFKKQNFAWRLTMGYVAAYNGKQVPLWERFFLGGENSLRGFGIRSVYPITEDGRYFLDPNTGTIQGGNRYYLLNNEYVFHVAKQVDVALFVDIGNSYHERQKIKFSNYRADAGFEIRFFIPTFNVPLRLIYATNVKPQPTDDFSNFQLSIGLTF